MRVLGIETSCDETSVAVVDGDGRVLSNVVSSQLAAHAPYGGVVPEIAARAHLENLPVTFERALAQAHTTVPEIDLVAATAGPGLIGALLVGLSAAKALAFARGVPLVPVNHLEGHLFSAFLRAQGEAALPVDFPFHGLVVSGGHAIRADPSSTGSPPAAQAAGTLFRWAAPATGRTTSPFPD